MKNNFPIKFKVFDVFILLFVVISIVATIITTNIVFSKSDLKDCAVQIFYRNDLVEEIKMSEVYSKKDYVLKKEDYKDLRGDMVISIDKIKGVCISEVVCPNHLCENMGWVKAKYMPIICIPNNVRVMISAPTIDQDITMQ